MRTLPDSPNMAFLRQEAKDVLHALRETHHTAALADAQGVVAAEYGFRTWSDLKTEVDRRREGVPAPPDGLAQAVASAYGLGPVSSMTPVRYEYMGRRWDLRTEHGRFIVRPVFDWIDDHQAELAIDIQERARAAGVQSPVPVSTSDERLVLRARDQSWRVDEWIDVGPAPVKPVPSSVAGRAGEVLAAIHEVAPATNLPVDGPWVSPADRPTPAAWSALLDRARRTDVPWVDRLVALSPAIDELSAVATEPPDDEVVITNRDLGIEHMRMGPNGDLIVMHWDFAGPLSREWELASTLIHWTNGGDDLDAARALAAGYRERHGSMPPLTLGSFATTITGMLTWILHRAWEAADPQPSEKRDYATRAVNEAFDDPLTVAKLTALINATR